MQFVLTDPRRTLLHSLDVPHHRASSSIIFSIFNAPRRYPRIYSQYSEVFNFYDGRDKWIESTTDAPKEAVILYALHWLHLEVYNGGFWQYFFNSTGTSYTEAVEGFRAIGMPEVASIVTSAASKLGNPYPFDADRRREIVGDSQNRMDFDNFEAEFYALADTDKFFRKLPKFVPFAEAFADAFENKPKDQPYINI